MKKLLYTLAAIFVSPLVLAQTDTENYVKTTSYQVATQDGTTNETGNNLIADDKLESISYYDGLGRPIQSIAKQAGGNKQDLITPVVYDALGRQTKDYLPYARTISSLNYEFPSTDDLLTQIEGQYLSKYPTDLTSSSPNPYSEKRFEASPLNRVLEQAAPGEDWAMNNGHTIKFDYQANGFEEVKQFSVSHPNNNTEQTELVYDGYYPINELYKTITKDENWTLGDNNNHTTEEFKNKQGQVVLKRTYASIGVGTSSEAEMHDTHYVYDRYGNLTYVIPPEAADKIIETGSQGFSTDSQTNFPWVDLVKVDKEFSDAYNKKLKAYENNNIRQADLTAEFSGQGGFTLSTIANSEQLFLNIAFSSTKAFQLKQGELVSLKPFGRYKDAELGRISGEGYGYIIVIKNNTIIIEGKGEISAINQSFTNTTKLTYSQYHPWTNYTDVPKAFAVHYEKQIQEHPPEAQVNTLIENEHNGQGGLQITVDDNDVISVSINSSATTPFKLKQGLVLPLKTRRKLKDRFLGTLSGEGYTYDLFIQENAVFIKGEGAITTLSASFIADDNLPTSVIAQGIADGFCYIYHYDKRNRLVEKKIPNKGWEHIVYDKLDRPVLTQSASLRLQNKWLFTKYDVFGRVVYTGVYNGSEDRLKAQVIFDDQGIQGLLNEEKQSIESSIDNTSIYYTNEVFPTANTVLHTINYYDNYIFDTSIENQESTIFNQPVTQNTKGLATGSKIRVLATDEWITSLTYYDDKARPVYVSSQNDYLKTDDIIKTNYNFIGNVLQTTTDHSITETVCDPVTDSNPYPNCVDYTTSIQTNDYFTYDHQNRLLTQSQTILANNQTTQPELIVNNSYDELGQLISKNVGGTVAVIPEDSQGLQTVDYAYNIRGWLKSINNGVTDSQDLFGFKLSYNNPEQGATPLYNGNISETYWQTANDHNQRSYTYSYDALNRITNASYHGNYNLIDALTQTEDYSLNNVGYDKNGNITHLKRTGLQQESNQIDTVDDLTYTYAPDSNQLIHVNDDATKDGFSQGSANDVAYQYDIDGNMISDANKGIASISYNHLNLPEEIVFTGQEASNSGTVIGNILYIYDATGVKLKKIVTDNGNISTTSYAGNYIYENTGSGDMLKFFNHAEGYVEPSENGFRYVYQYTDIWNNVRLSYSDLDLNGAIDPNTEILSEKSYYPFGLRHKGYNNVVIGTDNNYKQYQGQEFTEDLGLNIHEWKYRISDPAIGRFWQIDPLAEDYVYNSTYAFAENKLGMGIELEGAEIFTWAQQAAVADAAVNPNGVGAHVLGVSQGLANTVTGVIDAVSNPGQTLEGMGNMLVAGAAQGNPAMMLQADAALGTDSFGTSAAMSQALDGAVNDVVNGNGIERGTVIGEVIGSVVGTKGTNAALKGASTALKTTKVATKSVSAANGVKVTGFTKHGLNQKMNRGVKSSSVLDAVKNPLKTGDVKIDGAGRPSQRFTGAKAEVAVNPQTGKVVSTNPTSTKKAARLKRQQEQQ